MGKDVAHIHKEYYTVTRKELYLICDDTNGKESIVLGEISQTQKDGHSLISQKWSVVADTRGRVVGAVLINRY